MHCTLRRRHFGRIIIGKVPCDDVVKSCTFDVIKWCTTHQIFACVCLGLNQWSSCSLNKLLKRLSTLSEWDFVEMEYPERDVAVFRSPPMILRRPSDLFISAWMWVFTRFWMWVFTVLFKNLLHFSRARQGFGQTSYNENIVTNAHHPAVEVSFTDPSNRWMNSHSKANSL